MSTEPSAPTGATAATNPLLAYFEANEGRLLHKWQHYFDIYHRHLAAFRGQPVTVLEFGVFHGGSLHMWREYFGPAARIVGVDIDPRCAGLSDEQAEVVIGDQADRAFLAGLARDLGPLDVVIDDGGHTMEQQLATFDVLWPAVRTGGVLLVEDLHTSYWPEYGGGLRAPGTFIERTKALVDTVNAWHSRDADLVPDELTRTVGGIHVYDSIVVLDKADRQPPHHAVTGRPSFADEPTERFLAAQHSYEAATPRRQAG